MDAKERNEIINEAVEKTILLIPEIVGNLITNHAAKMKANKEFYDNHPEFKDFKQVVASVIEEVDDKNADLDFNELLEKAAPKIKRRIEKVKDLDLEKVEKPDLKIPFGSGDI